MFILCHRAELPNCHLRSVRSTMHTNTVLGVPCAERPIIVRKAKNPRNHGIQYLDLVLQRAMSC